MPNLRRGGRPLNELRPVEVTPGFHKLSEGSALYRSGGTLVLATASVDESVPEFMAGRGRGWVTAEYQMHPRSNPKRRESRDGRERPLGGRAREIQRLIGRALRAAVDLERLGERSIAIDCDVLEADGGTRTASVTAGFIALALALDRLRLAGIVEIQGTAEGEAVPRSDIDRMVDLALVGIEKLVGIQERVLGDAGVELKRLMRD